MYICVCTYIYIYIVYRILYVYIVYTSIVLSIPYIYIYNTYGILLYRANLHHGLPGRRARHYRHYGRFQYIYIYIYIYTNYYIYIYIHIHMIIISIMGHTDPTQMQARMPCSYDDKMVCVRSVSIISIFEFSI